MRRIGENIDFGVCVRFISVVAYSTELLALLLFVNMIPVSDMKYNTWKIYTDK